MMDSEIEILPALRNSLTGCKQRPPRRIKVERLASASIRLPPLHLRG